MKEIYRFLKIKAHTIIIFILYILFLFISKIFGLNQNYILYIILFSVFMFIISLTISYLNYQKVMRELDGWVNDISANIPGIVKDTYFANKIIDLEKEHKIMEDAFEAKMRNFKEYISIWTHQIKTPLFSLDLILNDYPVDSHLAKAEVFEIEEYIITLLSYMRLESLSTDFVFEQISLDELISASIKKYSKVFIRKKNNVNFKPTGLEITTDKKWFSLILDQILSNSNKYTQKGSISIYMKEESLIIEDTGIGIRKEDLPRVFDKSYTGYNGRIYKKSTGIGLSLVKDAAENLSIDVGIDSTLGEGTKLILNLSRVIN